MKLCSHLRVYEVGDQHLLLNTGGRTADMTAAFGINEPAAWLLRRMEGKDFEVEDLVEWLCGEYEVDADTAKEDVEALLKVLGEHSLLID